MLSSLGQTTPAAQTNVAGSGQTVNDFVIVGVNNAGVPVVLKQYLTGWNGFYIVGFTIPSNAPTGADQALSVAVILSNGQVVYSQQVFLPGVQ